MIRRIIILISIISLLFFIGCSNKNIDMSKATKVEDKLYRIGGKNVLAGEFDAYYLLRDFDKNKVPILLHLELEYQESDDKKISDCIKNMHASLVGIDGHIEMSVYEDNDYFYIMSILVNTDNLVNSDKDNLSTDLDNEGEIAFLKKKFDEQIKILDIDDEITYEIENNIDSYMVDIRMRRDPITNKVSLTIDDEGEAQIVK